MSTSPTRRSFLASAAGAVAAASFIRTSAAADPVIVGSGSHRYACLHDWGTLPPSIQYGLTHGVVVDRAGNVHVLHTSRRESESKHCVVTFDARGNFVRSWGEQFFGGAHGFDLVVEDGREVLFITDLTKGLFKATLDGQVIWHVENPRPDWYARQKLRYRPSNVAVAPSGEIFYADGYGSHYIHKLDARGRWIKTFGGPGWEKGQTNHPHGLFIDRRGPEPLLVVAMNPTGADSRSAGLLQAFNLDGEHHSFLPTEVRSPRHFDQQGELVVIPDLDARVSLIGPGNQPIAQLGDGWTTKEEVRTLRTKPRDQFIAGKFICPHDAAFDKDGSIFIAEWVNVGRVTKLQRV